MQILDAIPPGALTALILALLISSAGFYRVVYFVSIGYAFSISAMALSSAWLYRASLEPLVSIQLALLALYGLRLGSFLIGRERRASYRKHSEHEKGRSRGIGMLGRIGIWSSVSVLYVLMFYPALVVLHHGDPGSGTLLPGILVMSLGLVVEAVADRQKSGYKAEHPDRFCDVGLFRVVRCPNYFGEMVFWLGQFIVVLGYWSHWSHLVASAAGFVCIQLIMVGSTKRLEHEQGERYGDREDYRRYVRSVPVLFPWLPLYSMKNARIYLG